MKASGAGGRELLRLRVRRGVLLMFPFVEATRFRPPEVGKLPEQRPLGLGKVLPPLQLVGVEAGAVARDPEVRNLAEAEPLVPGQARLISKVDLTLQLRGTLGEQNPHRARDQGRRPALAAVPRMHEQAVQQRPRLAPL